MVFFLIFFLSLLGQQAFSQEKKWLQLELSGGITQRQILAFEDTLGLVNYVKSRYQEIALLGYLNPLAMPQSSSSDTLSLHIQTGERFEWLHLGRGNVDPLLWVKSGIDVKQFQNKPFEYEEVAKVFAVLLRESENSGFPFSSIKLDSIQRAGKGFSASLNLDPGPFIAFDSLRITGNSKINPTYLSKLLQIRPGDPFSQKKVDQGIGQIKNLPYLRWEGEPELSFQNEEAILYLPLNDRRMNTLDGIIGFLPNEIENNKLLVTGQFDLALYNVGGRGRNYQLNWQRLSQYSQNLKVSGIEPLILGSMLDIKASFYLLKEDTTFLNRDFRVDLGYRPSANGYLSFFYRRQAGDLLAVSDLGQITTLPEFLDFRFNNYGVQYELFLLDDVFQARRGFYGQFEFGVGNKSILQNTGIPQSVYEGLDAKTVQYFVKGALKKYFYLNQNFGAFTGLSAGMMDSKNLFGNDLYRLGGLKSIRGFNENYFFAQNYIYFNVEPRFYFDTYSYFLIFADLGRLGNNVQGFPADYPVSTGVGISLETGSGIFNFIYALGKSNAQEFVLNFSKIHFGYTGRF
ncbi:POTRA domain-containing protein [Rhodonellum sp.]|uniref:POTRA domain-containing protein n=1 Tax=Rhodonellum sp. TaxID=2231180 RepID=UPI00271B139E|nr:POTRA domain-containing protein [Rhodonellum sp.]MDO9553628.1 POTRA domain-containing protein [Rhodonellum sp.]